MGRSAHVSFSYNASTQSEKIKFTLDNAYDAHGTYRPLLFGALLAAQHAIDCAVTTDKGHKSSNGSTVVEFWCKQPPLERPCAATVSVVDEIIEVTRMPLPLSTRPSDGASLLASGITFDSVPDVADVAPCDHVADLALHADLLMHHSRLAEIKHQLLEGEQLRSKFFERTQALEQLQRQYGADHPNVCAIRANLYRDVRANVERERDMGNEVVALTIKISERRKHYDG